DRSIMDPDAFIQTGVYGTYVMLEAAREFGLERYHQISTDEVYGDIPAGYSSVESDPLRPRSPYSASKASGDLLVGSYFTTYELPVTISRGSNNIGPYQHLEKVVPLFTTNALENKPLPLYGDGGQMREYQYVVDHCEAIDLILHQGQLGEIYNVGTGVEVTNLRMVELLLETLGKPQSLVRRVTDRPGHDRRYSMNIEKIRALGWTPRHTPEEAIIEAVSWYRDNEWWWRRVKNEEFAAYYEAQYGDRLRQDQ
ncbi:MAG: GDP-mannose 4,6-dehydratase, partial [Anaerolineales bacterium]|nr:GDP-mannose 4,6-dehydratase [Anaerolineales bacterium]